MFDILSFIAGALSGLLVGVIFMTTRTRQAKEESERLNKKLHVLTDRDERGRFKGGK
jgi:hypothetical protein